MSDSDRPRAVLDADIIYSRVMHRLRGLDGLVAAVVIDGLGVDLGESEEDLAEQLFAQ